MNEDIGPILERWPYGDGTNVRTIVDADGIEKQGDPLTIIYDDAGSGIAYVSEAEPGVATSAAEWRLKRTTTTGLDILTEWADGNANFDNVHDDRASKSYS